MITSKYAVPLLMIALILPALAQTTVLTGQATKTTVAVPSTYQTQRPISQPTTTAPLQGTVNKSTVVHTTTVHTATVHTPKVYVKDNRTFFQRHPMVKNAAKDGAIGAAGGAALGLITHRGIMRGALIGGGAGAGVGMVRTSKTMRRHPIMRDVATGALVGGGVGGSVGSLGKGAGIGAAVGLGVGLFKHAGL